MNTLKKIAMLLVFILIQNKISAQTQDNASAHDIHMKNTTSVNINSEVNHKSFTNVSSGTTGNTQTLMPLNGIKNDSDSENASNVDLILPQVIDPTLMDIKPE